MSRITTKTTALSIAAFASLMPLTAPVQAGAPFSEFSCKELWLERNSLYAYKGHCFTSPRALAKFGRVCKPPYGKMTPSEKAKIAEMRMWERKKGCRAD